MYLATLMHSHHVIYVVGVSRGVEICHGGRDFVGGGRPHLPPLNEALIGPLVCRHYLGITLSAIMPNIMPT